MDATLVMFKENGERRDFALLKETTAVGRGQDCDLRIPLAGISRNHCQFIISGTKVLVQDAGSRNGTFVNNQQVSGATALSAGDGVAIGPAVFTLQIDGQPAEIKPVRRAPGVAADGEEPTSS